MTDHNDRHSSLPERPEPFWRVSTQLASFPALSQDIETDVAIVGGGISGLTTAYLLAKAGKRVALLEADVLANGTTGHTTAKITAQHDIIYDELISHIGKEQAKLYYEASMDALRFIRNLVKEEKMECDFSDQDAYLFTTTNQGVKKLEDEYNAYQELGIPGELRTSIPVKNIPVKAALVMKEQAQFHPLMYIAHLIKGIVDNGGSIYEQTVALDIEEKSRPVILTKSGAKVEADHVVIASHFPFFDGSGLYFSKMYPSRSYVVAAKVDNDFPEGMYLSVDSPSRSLRYTMMDGEKLVLIGGQNHKTGHGIDTLNHYEALEQYGQEIFQTLDIRFRWSAQDLTTLDKIPYIGRHSKLHPSIFVATGYRKWGMTNSTVAALLISDLILQRPNRYQELFSPGRFVADPSIRNFISQNTDVAKQLFQGKFDQTERKPEEVKKGEGTIVNVNGKRAGAYREQDGTLHVVDTTCTHMGCEVHWNHGDHTWDCPCHGSRFSFKGEVVEGPAKQPLKSIKTD
ncbi:FAD-dependent oxidoreductase [Alkalihalobacillus oceani]|uniref:FAD-dependent oxidoreductase n=1 Tax=Halalkalibacter oceani TaxID=1653776 RepID=UPI002041B7FD|nr:FAD-dependent oxidoreductase [Halalkalibacter oceani]MCM3759981.1 FAD-dependent oxidoreductase [Halalkalibacter oceani]